MADFIKNEAQEEAVRTIHGPVILISCPGSGKTTTLIRRIHAMIQAGVRPSEILMVTFANAAARDMNARYAAMYGRNPGVTFATIHSLCFNILRIDGGLTKDSLLSERDKQEFFFMRLRSMSWVNDAWDMTKAVLTDLSVLKSGLYPRGTFQPKSCKKDSFDALVRAYEDEKDLEGKIDFDDMLTRCLTLLEHKPEVLAKWQARFRYIQCDEYQDTNAVQRDILYLLAGKDKNLCVVGDDDQSIYRFRGADSRIMLSFTNDFPEAKKIVMSTNYRSAQKIVDLSGLLVKHNRVRFKKDFLSFRGQSGEKGTAVYKVYPSRSVEMDQLVKFIEDRHAQGVPYKDMAVLVRTNQQAAPPLQALSDAQIPFQTTETVKSMYDDWMFEDIATYIRLGMGEGSKADMLHVLNRPSRYLKPALFANADYTAPDMLAAVEALQYGPQWKYTAARKSIATWMKQFGPGTITADTEVADLFARIKAINYRKYITQAAEFRNADEEEAMESFKALHDDAMQFKTVGEWLAHAKQVSAAIRETSRKKDQNGVMITTMHKAKGMEWDTVFLSGVSASVLPGKNTEPADLEEERRILYVGMTRAKNALYISCTGTESPFMQEAMHDLREKEHPTIRKKLAGAPVEHQKLGRGQIVCYFPDHVVIRFPDLGKQSFAFPEAFQKKVLQYV